MKYIEEMYTDVHESPNTDALVAGFRENLINFTLKCREKNIIPQTVHQDIFDDVKNLFQDFKEHYDFYYFLPSSAKCAEDCPELLELLKSADFLDDDSKVLSSEYLSVEYRNSVV